MMKLHERQNAEDISSCMDRFLTEHQLVYTVQLTRQYDVFDVCLPETEFFSKGTHVTVYVQPDMILFEADVPAAGVENNVLAVLANRLNMQYMTGTYQVDVRYGESNWLQYIPVRDNRWPGDERVFSALCNTAYMAGKIRQGLNALTERTENTGNREVDE